MDEFVKLVDESFLLPPDPHKQLAELLFASTVLQAAVMVVRVFKTSAGRDDAMQVVEINFVAPILAFVGIFFAVPILGFILFASRAGLSTWLEILTTAKTPENFPVSEIFQNMPHVHRLTIFLLTVAPSSLKLWASSYRRLATVFTAQIGFYLAFSRVAEMKSGDIFAYLLGFNIPAGIAYTIALTALFFSRYAVPWVVGSVIAIAFGTVIKAVKEKGRPEKSAPTF